MNRENTIGLTRLSQTLQQRHLYHVYTIKYKINGDVLYHHFMTSLDLNFVLDRLNLGGDARAFPNSFIFDNTENEKDVLNWCRQLNRLIGVYRESVFLDDHYYKTIDLALQQKTSRVEIQIFK